MKMRYFSLILISVSMHFAQAQTFTPAEPTPQKDLVVGNLNITDVCRRDTDLKKEFSIRFYKNLNQDMFFLDKGFCNAYNKTVQSESSSTSKWKINFYASHSFTEYQPTDVQLNSSRYQVTIHDYQWEERGSRSFFEPQTWAEEGNNPAQIIDEPTNKFVLSFEKDGHVFFLSAFHPKFVQQPDQVKEIDGVIDGKAVSGQQPVNGISWDPINNVPGVSRIVKMELSHKQMQYEVGYGRRLNILKSKPLSLVYVPSVGIGIMMGAANAIIVKNEQWVDYENVTDKDGINGFGLSINNRLEMRFANETFGLFYENQRSFYKMNHGFMDGTMNYNLNYVGHQFGLQFLILSHKNKWFKNKDGE